jgi:hypothetical protein
MPENQQSEAYLVTMAAIYAQESEDSTQESEDSTQESEDSTQESEDSTNEWKACGAKHSFCKVGLGECGMREGHKSWGQDHVCNKCDATW